MKRNIFSLLILILLAAAAFAATPAAVRYQGTLRYQGQPAAGTYTMRFVFCNSDGSAQYWDSGDVSVTAINGAFTFPLNVSGVNWNTPPSGGYYLQISVNGELLLPREAVVSNIYSLQAGNVDDNVVTMQKLSGDVQAKINATSNPLVSTNTWTAPQTYASSSTFLNNVGITSKLTVTSFAMTTGATNGYVLSSDASGNATWVQASSASVAGILSTTNTWTAPQTYASSTTFNALVGISTANAYAINISSYVKFLDGTVITSTSTLGGSGTGTALLSSTNTWTAPNNWTSSATFQNNVEINGRVTVSSFTLPATGVNGYVLTANASGDGTWLPAGAGNFLSSTNTWTAPNTWTSSATFQNDVGINGRVTVSSFTLSATGVNGYVLTADGSGNGTWQVAGSGNLTNSTSTWTAPQTYASSTTFNALVAVSTANAYAINISSYVKFLDGTVITSTSTLGGSGTGTALLSSTNTWTAPQTYASSSTFNDLVAVSTANAYAINISSYVKFIDGTVITSTSTLGGNGTALLSSTNTWTAPQTYASSSTFNGLVGIFTANVYAVNISSNIKLADGTFITSTAPFNMFSLLSSTNIWTAPQTHTSSTTFTGLVGISTANAYAVNISSYIGLADGTFITSTAPFSMFSLLSSTNIWTAPQTHTSSTTFTGLVGISTANAYAVNISSNIKLADGTFITSTAPFNVFSLLSSTNNWTAPNTSMSSATFQNSEFSVGGSTLVVSGGWVTIASATINAGNLNNQVYNLGVSTGLIAVSTGAIQAQLNSIVNSTNTWTAAQIFQSSVTLNSNSAIYFGDPNTAGSWRIQIDTTTQTNLIFQKYDGSSWSQKASIIP